MVVLLLLFGFTVVTARLISRNFEKSNVGVVGGGGSSGGSDD